MTRGRPNNLPGPSAADNESEEGRAKNRRVAFKILGRNEEVAKPSEPPPPPPAEKGGAQ